MRTTQERRIELDFLRGIAILLACGWHFNGRDTGVVVIDLLQMPGRALGWAGVDLFFVLSGFLVGGLVLGEYHKTGTFKPRRFLVRRAFKIWPVLYLYIALLVITGRYAPGQVVPQTLFHVQNYFLTPLNHLWSLAVEEHFYLTFAVLFLALARSASRRIELLPYFLAGLMVLAPLLRILGALAGVEPHTLQIQTQFRIDALACGVMLAYLKVFRASAFNTLAVRKTALGIASIAGVAALLALRGDPVLIATAGYSIAYLTGAAFLLFVDRLPIVVNRNRAARAIAWIGTYSYAMYVFQFVFFRAAESVWKRFSPDAIPALLDIAIRYVGALTVAIVVTKLLERPMLALRDRLVPATKSVQPEVQASA